MQFSSIYEEKPFVFAQSCRVFIAHSFLRVFLLIFDSVIHMCLVVIILIIPHRMLFVNREIFIVLKCDCIHKAVIFVFITGLPAK